MNLELEALLTRLEQEGLALEAQAVRRVRQLYSRLPLADLFTLAEVFASQDRLLTAAERGQLVQAFEGAARQLEAAATSFDGLLAQGVQRGASGAVEMLAASGLSISFQVPPEVQRRYLERSTARFGRYWRAEGTRFAGEVQDVLITGLDRGLGVEQVARDLRGRVNVSRSRSLLIASNELGNAAAYAQEQTQRDLGVTQYRWRTAQDSRVRDSHRDRDGELFSWDDPPPDGHPGEPIRCRCVALAVIPGEAG
jgi:SPP1 gp7 family putative phage head morphogenesis protein